MAAQSRWKLMNRTNALSATSTAVSLVSRWPAFPSSSPSTNAAYALSRGVSWALVEMDDTAFEALADAQIIVNETMSAKPTQSTDEQPVHITMKPQGAPIKDEEEEP